MIKNNVQYEAKFESGKWCQLRVNKTEISKEFQTVELLNRVPYCLLYYLISMENTYETEMAKWSNGRIA